MIAAKELQDLLAFQTDSPEIVSVFLELDGPQSHRQNLKHLLEGPSAKEIALQGFQQDLDRVKRLIGEELKPGAHRGLAVFSARRRNFWQVCLLPEPVNNLIRLRSRPILAPLVNITDQYRRYGIALVDAERAKFFEVYLGEIEECSEPFVKNPRSHAQAVADHLMFLSRARRFERIVLGAPPELESLLIGHMHSFIQNNLILDTQLNTSVSPAQVLEKISLSEKQSRKVRESVLVHRLIEQAHGGGLGVVGLKETLYALEYGQARLLLVRDGLSKMGRICRSCGHLTLSGKRCHACYRNTEPLFNIVGEMIQAALDLNCEVVRVVDETPLDNVGGIGAELKFKTGLGPEPVKEPSPAPPSKTPLLP